MSRMLLPNLFEEIENICNCFGDCDQERVYQTAGFGLTIAEDSEKFYIDVPVPGVKADEVEVSLDREKKRVVAKGRVKSRVESERKEVKYHRRALQEFAYEIPLYDLVDYASAADAVCKDGILSLTLNKPKNAQPIKIDVKS